MNVALYGKPARWAMTERGRASLRRGPSSLDIGASSMRWDGEVLTISIDEITVPFPSRLRGTVTVRPRALSTRVFSLDPDGRHRWQPIAPSCDVSVAFERPALAWRGGGYLDTNNGDEPLEAAFRSWTWSRFDAPDGSRVFYDVVTKDGVTRPLSLAVDRHGAIMSGQTFPHKAMPRGLWGIERAVPCEDGGTPMVRRALEDAPFYTRSEITTRIDGRDAAGVHESLSLTRLASPWVRMVLPFRMPRSG